MTETADVSVVIPVYNGANYLGRAIESVLSQTGITTELIVVDDASTDATPDIARGYGDAVHYVPLSKQATSIATTNAGIRLCTGEFVSILHHDDYFLPGKLSAHVNVMRLHPRVGLSYSAQHYVGPRDERLWTFRSPLARTDYVIDGQVELQHLVVQNYINFCNAVVRRSAYEQVGLYSEPLWFSAEWDMWIRLARQFDVAYVSTPLVAYRLHYGAQTLTGTKDPQDLWTQLEPVHRSTFAERNLPEAVRVRQRWSEANMHLSVGLLQLIRRDYGGAKSSIGHVIRKVRPWEVRGFVRSSALVPRTAPRIRLFTAERRRRSHG